MKNIKAMFVILVLILTIVVSCGVDSGEVDNIPEIEVSDYFKETYKNKVPSSVTSEIDIVIYNNKGQETAIIYGDRSEFVDGDVILQNMRVLFKSKGENGQENSTLISDYGKINMGKRIESWGKVIMIKENEYRLETEKIIWEKGETKAENSTETTNGNLKTEKGKLVTIYYTDGTIIRGRNGYWEQGGNRIRLEERYTETSSKNTSENGIFSPNLGQNAVTIQKDNTNKTKQTTETDIRKGDTKEFNLENKLELDISHKDITNNNMLVNDKPELNNLTKNEVLNKVEIMKKQNISDIRNKINSLSNSTDIEERFNLKQRHSK